MNSPGGLPKKTLNGLLNGHQVFRLIWLAIIVVYGLLYGPVPEVDLLAQRNILFGPAVLLLGFVVSEWIYRFNFNFKFGAPQSFTKMSWPRFADHLH